MNLIRLIDIDPWFKTNVEMFNCNYAYPVEGTCPEFGFPANEKAAKPCDSAAFLLPAA